MGTAALGLSLGFQAAVAGPPPERDAYVREAISTLCRAPGKPLVVDSFSETYRIVGGAALEPPSLGFGSHGDLVGPLLKRDYIAYNIPQNVPLYMLARIFTNIADDIESGAIQKPSFINLSSGIFLSLEMLNLLKPDLMLTPDNVAGKREELLEAFINSQGTYPNYHEIIYIAFKRLARMGITTVTVAGNDFSPDKINYYSLLPGTITAGALAYDGTIAPLSNDTSLTDFYRPGDVIGRKMGSGMDINNDDIRDFPRFSGVSAIIQAYNGKAPEEVLKTLSDDIQMHKKKSPELLPLKLAQSPPPEGLYRARDIYEIIYPYPLSANYLKDIELYGEYIHYPSRTPFRLDSSGKLLFDPLNKGENPLIIAHYKGSSFAAPRVCGP
jgi:hypothetical protein